MASVYRTLCAALAAVSFLVLSGCGGGGSATTPSAPVTDKPIVAVPFTGSAVDRGTVFDGSPRAQALSVPPSVAPATIEIRFTPAKTGQGGRAQALAVNTDQVSNDELFDWAAVRYPSLFVGAASTNYNVLADGNSYDYRDYRGNLVGVRVGGSDVGGVYGIGPYTGNVLVRFGALGDFKCQVKPTLCGPKLLQATLVTADRQVPADGATDVVAKLTRLTLTYDQVLNCTGVSGTGKMGQVLATVTCDSAGKTVNILPGLPGEERWPMGASNTLTVGGIQGSLGYPSAATTLSFTTRSATTNGQVFVGNWKGNFTTKAGVSIVSASGASRTVHLGDALGSYQFTNGHLAWSAVAGVVYAAPATYAQFLYRLDGETGVVLSAFQLDPAPALAHGIHSVASSPTQVCVILGNQYPDAYIWQGKVICFNHLTGERLETGPGFIPADMVSMRLHYSATTGKFYSLNAARSGMYGEQDTYKSRDGYRAGTSGTVTEFGCESSCQISRTFTVGSVPQDVVEDGGVLSVANSGDNTLSTITLSTGNVVTRGLPGLTGQWQHAMRLLIDPVTKRLLVSDYDSHVVAYDPATLQETGRVMTGDMPMGMTLVGNEVWVALPRKDIWFDGDSVAVLDRQTLAVKRVIAGVGPQPWAILAPN